MNVKSGLFAVVLQFVPLTDEPTCRTSEVPPVPNPSVSDIVSRNCFFSAKGSKVEKVPFPEAESTAVSGIEMFSGDVKGCEAT